MDIIVLLPVLFFSIILHEFAHGWLAYRMGDDTAYLSGRLTINPISHVDPIGTIAIPAICWLFGWPMFCWAKPVPVNAMRLPSPRKDMGKVAFAGPAVNLIWSPSDSGKTRNNLLCYGTYYRTFQSP